MSDHSYNLDNMLGIGYNVFRRQTRINKPAMAVLTRPSTKVQETMKKYNLPSFQELDRQMETIKEDTDSLITYWATIVAPSSSGT
jgi:hypothetical protein